MQLAICLSKSEILFEIFGEKSLMLNISRPVANIITICKFDFEIFKYFIN